MIYWHWDWDVASGLVLGPDLAAGPEGVHRRRTRGGLGC